MSAVAACSTPTAYLEQRQCYENQQSPHVVVVQSTAVCARCLSGVLCRLRHGCRYSGCDWLI